MRGACHAESPQISTNWYFWFEQFHWNGKNTFLVIVQFSLLPEGSHGGIYQRGVETVEELRPVELNTNCAPLPGDENPRVAGQSDLIQAVAQLVLQHLHCDPAQHFQDTDWVLSVCSLLCRLVLFLEKYCNLRLVTDSATTISCTLEVIHKLTGRQSH